jgi:hypothetical protein
MDRQPGHEPDCHTGRTGTNYSGIVCLTSNYVQTFIHPMRGFVGKDTKYYEGALETASYRTRRAYALRPYSKPNLYGQRRRGNPCGCNHWKDIRITDVTDASPPSPCGEGSGERFMVLCSSVSPRPERPESLFATDHDLFATDHDLSPQIMIFRHRS